MVISVGGASVDFIDGDICHLKDLENTGKPSDLVRLWKMILRLAGDRPIRCVVLESENMKRLLESYQNLGFVPYGILMEKS